MQRKVLLVEDEDNIALALQYLIENEGRRVRRVADAPAARAALEAERPDLVLLDAMLPGGSGYEICQEIRLNPEMRDVKILMLTAAGGAMNKRKSLALGADAFVSKPFSNAEVQGVLGRLLEPTAA